MIHSEVFKESHRQSETDFTRNRTLTFSVVIILIVQKSLKSLQLVLNEFIPKLGEPSKLVTASAFTQARRKLSSKAFIELNQKGIVDLYYQDQDYQRFKGFRLLAIDGSKIPLPDTPAIRKEFGTIRFNNNSKGNGSGSAPAGLASVMYDVLNHIAIDSTLGKAKAYEVDLSIDHLQYANSDDLVLYDRNYPSYRNVATHTHKKINFLIRCSKASFKTARLMFDPNKISADQVVTLRPHHTKKKQIKALGLPMQITVRFVRVILSNGDVEILITSLINQKQYPLSIFKELYNLRWGIETYYGVIYDRLNLENFSGLTPDAIYQDFYATIFISNIESVVTEDAQSQLDQKQVVKENKYPQQVNKAVSFNAIKNHAIELFYRDEEPVETLNQLSLLFLKNPVCVRKNRYVPRKKPQSRKLWQYHKRRKKICF